MWQQLLPEGVDRRPPWLTVRMPVGGRYTELDRLMRGQRLHTVCEEARCPNLGECWSHGTATFIILGDICTRACAFCAVRSGRPEGLDQDEPRRVAEAVREMGITHAVITSVDRDDLPDGGAAIFAATIREVKELSPGCAVEVLTPDFQGSRESIATVLEAGPEVFNHNIETVPRLFPRVRPKSAYRRSLGVLAAAAELAPEGRVKSGLMVGLGESMGEVKEVLRDLRDHRVRLVTIGQYLRPSLKHIRCDRFWRPEEFLELREYGMGLGFDHVESGPLVRSSYHAHEQAQAKAAG
ncbi:MAG: lipoyl synthase [Candidatus Dormibacteraeota bacterium]|nr:lipoyl synthase [Candidatus Dormibacteraeota bacterium]